MKKIAILIPAHNEEDVLSDTIMSVLKIIDSKDLYIVNDGSSDKTQQVALKFTKNILQNDKSLGKANALNAAIKHFKLADTYEYIMPLDADCIVSPDFLEKIFEVLDKDNKEKIACAIGRVVGRNKKWITSYRLWEYEITQSVHKSAQSVIDAVIVCPGPSTVFRSRIFKEYKIPSGTLTEDMDMTFLIHRKKLGKITFVSDAIVTTQDPDNTRDYIKQVQRWYLGFWQCIIKHNIPWGGQTLDAEVSMLALEGLYNGLLVLSLFFLVPFAIIKNAGIFAIPIAVDFFIFFLPTILYTAKVRSNLGILFFIPHFYFLRTISSLVFLQSFLRLALSLDLKLNGTWNTNRYKIGKEDIWPNPYLQ